MILELIGKFIIIIIEIMGVLGGALLLQLIVYQVSKKKINLYKMISYNLIDKYIK